MKEEESRKREWEQRDKEAKKREREELREAVDEATNFLGDGLTAEVRYGDVPRFAVPITADFATFYVLVPKDAPSEWWSDPRIEIGTCPYHQHPPGIPVEENPCPYQACSVLVGKGVKQLYLAAWSELLSASPDLPHKLLWSELLQSWKPVRVHLSLVRVAWLTDLPMLGGGEPQVRRWGRALRGKDSPAWEQLRDVVRVHCASLAVIPGDPMGHNFAARLIVFKAPFQALWKAGAIRMEPADSLRRPSRWVLSVRLGHRLQVTKPPTWPPRHNRLRDRLHFEFTMWRANRRQVQKERRERKRVRRSARREIIRRELALDEPNAEIRAHTRRALIATVREALGLAVDFWRSLRRLLFSWLVVPPGAALLLILHHLLT